MGNTTVSFWVFEAKRNVIRNLVLQNHWKGKMDPSWTMESKVTDTPPNCDPDVRKLPWLLPQVLSQLPLKPQSWWLKTECLSLLLPTHPPTHTTPCIPATTAAGRWHARHYCLPNLLQLLLTGTRSIISRILDSRDFEKCRFSFPTSKTGKCMEWMMREVSYSWPQSSGSEFSQYDTQKWCRNGKTANMISHSGSDVY